MFILLLSLQLGNGLQPQNFLPSPMKSGGRIQMTSEQKQLIDKITDNQDLFEYPTDIQPKTQKVSVSLILLLFFIVLF